MNRPLVASAVLAFVCPLACLAQSDQPDTLTGPVTAITSPTAFDVSGEHVTLSPEPQLCALSSGKLAVSKCEQRSAFAGDLYIGERVELSGNDHPPYHSFTAYKVTIQRVQHNISGIAIVDLMPAAQPSDPAERSLRADGFLLRITSDSKLKFEPPLSSLADVSSNLWIQYSGTLQSDGTVLVKSADIKPNTISRSEGQMLKQADYDPSSISKDARQNSVLQAVLGIDPKKIPPYLNEAMQARIERIGNSLIPAYQRALPDSDPTKINFRFQLVDKKPLRGALSTPAGVILVPYQVVQRLRNDDQLAAVLAESIAVTFEKDSLRIGSLATASKVGTAAQLATMTLPVANLAVGAAALGVSSKAQKEEDAALAQSARVSLWLLHDAGYNIQQAPLAWWMLASKKEKPLDQVSLPLFSKILYEALGTIWRNASPAVGPSTATGAQK